MRRYFLFLAVGMMCMMGAVLALSMFIPETEQPSVVLHRISLQNPSGNNLYVNIERAVTEDELRVGLMYRKSVDHGMLFIFENEQPLSFWMKNTLVPLDVVFFDRKGAYVSALSMQPCIIDPCPVYPSGNPAQFALEMPAGFLEQTPVGQGWNIVP